VRECDRGEEERRGERREEERRGEKRGERYVEMGRDKWMV
jgi:hypothetical protein